MLEKRGLILMVGATGSGKSTSLAAMIDHRNGQQSGHIITIEDPIEFLFKHKRSIVNQRELGTDAKSYHVALKNALRQAPDVILIGEVRDRETMTMAIAYAQSGHLCLATLHANNSYHALNRIISFYPLENRAGAAAGPVRLAEVRRLAAPRSSNLKGGRSASVEVMLNTRHVADLIEKGEVNEIKEAMDKSLAPGSQTFEQSLFKMYRDGVDLAGRGARERRLGHQPALADEQHRPDHRRIRRRARPEAGPPAGGRAARRAAPRSANSS